jgi:heme oxygenase
MTPADVLHRLRTATAEDHQRVEDALGLLSPVLDRVRLTRALSALHGFWVAAESGLDRWAALHPADAARLDWRRRRRAQLYAADLRSLGSPPSSCHPSLPDVDDTDAALGRMYVLEGSTLGGTFIDRHLTTVPALAGVRLRAFTPYGARTGAMWHSFRSATRSHVADGGDADRVVSAARATFASLSDWVGAWPALSSAHADLWTSR